MKKTAVLLIMFTLVYNCALSAQCKKVEVRKELFGAKQVGPFRFESGGKTYFQDPRSGDMNKFYCYGNMTREEYNKLHFDMMLYHFKYEQHTASGNPVVFDVAKRIAYKDWGFETEISRYDTVSRNEYKTVRFFDPLKHENDALYIERLQSLDPPGIYEYKHDGNYSQKWGYTLWKTGEVEKRSDDFYYDAIWDDFMPYIRVGRDMYLIGTDFSLKKSYLYPDKFKVWFDIKRPDAISDLGMIDNDAIKVYNPEAVFIYVYDFDEFRDASSDWEVHDRMVYGYEEDTPEDMNSPFEKLYGTPGYERMCRFTWGPIIGEENSDINVAARAYIHIRTELAKDYIASNVHPAPDMDFKTWDYTYDSPDIDYSEDTIYPGFKEYQDVDRCSERFAIESFVKRIDSMCIYDYWAGIYKSSVYIVDIMREYLASMDKYIASGYKDKKELKKMQIATRKYNLLEAYRDRYVDMALRPANDVTRKADLKEYFSEKRLSIAVWSGSTGAGSWKHRYDPGLKTAIPYFEGKDKPGLMGYIDGTKEEVVHRVMNLHGSINMMLEDWGYPFDHKALSSWMLLGIDPRTGMYGWMFDYEYKGEKHTAIRFNGGIPCPFGWEYSGWQKGNVWSNETQANFFKLRAKRWKFTDTDAGPTIEKVPRGVITNTGGLLFGGYIAKSDDISYLKSQYGSMRNAWNAALKGPYMIVSSRTYERLGHDYFEKRAGHRLFKAVVTGAMIDASAKTLVTVKDKDPQFAKAVKSRYFQIGERDAEVPGIDYNHFRGQYTKVKPSKNKTVWMNEQTLLPEIEIAMKKDAELFPGCSILRSSYIINPDKTKGLLSLVQMRNHVSEKDTVYDCIYKPYPTELDKLHSEIILKLYPSFAGNPNLFLVYYNNIGKIEKMIKKHIFTHDDGYYDADSDFFRRGGPGGTTSCLETNSYHGIYGDYKVCEYDLDSKNTRIESIMARYLSKSYEKAYLETRNDRKDSFRSRHSALNGVYISQARIACLDEKTRSTFNFPYRYTSAGYDIARNNDDYMIDLTYGQGQMIPRMTNHEDEQLFLQDLGYQRQPDNQLRNDYADIDKVAKLAKFFPGMINTRDIRRLYEYANYSVQNALPYKFKASKIFPGSIETYYSTDYEPGLISETYLRMNYDKK